MRKADRREGRGPFGITDPESATLVTTVIYRTLVVVLLHVGGPLITTIDRYRLDGCLQEGYGEDEVR